MVLVARVLLTVIASAFLTAAAVAQDADPAGVNCDENLKPAPETEKAREERTFCETHAGCLMVYSYLKKTCRAAQFLRDIGEHRSITKTLTNNDVAEALTDDYNSAAADKEIAEARLASRPSPKLKNEREMFVGPDGTKFIFEGQNDPKNHFYQRGTIITSDGTVVRGRMRKVERVIGAGGQIEHLQGGTLREGENPLKEFWDAQAIMPDGQIKAGYLLNNLRLVGEGVLTTKEPDGRTSILEGSFIDDKPDDEMVRRYSDGTSRREFWQKGKLVAVGDLSAPGRVPPKISRPDVAPLAYDMGMHEGPYLQVDGPRERYLLACNQQIIAVGEWGPSGKAPPPSPLACPNPERYRRGKVTVRGNKWPQARAEYWCNGKMVAATPYANYPPQQYVKPAPECIKETYLPTPDSAFRTGNMIERTLEPSKTRPVATTGRVTNPLIVQGPPWPCAGEIDAYIAASRYRARGGGILSAQQYWADFQYSPIRILVNSGERTLAHFHNQYVSGTSGASSQSLTFNGLREGFFRNARSMLALASSYDAARAEEARGGGGSGSAMNACIARYLATNARD